MSRSEHGCGTIDGSGSKEVVVAGDFSSSDGDSVELYSFAMDSWRTGEEFNFIIDTCKISHFFLNKRDHLSTYK